jgi:hypothetical protein
MPKKKQKQTRRPPRDNEIWVESKTYTGWRAKPENPHRGVEMRTNENLMSWISPVVTNFKAFLLSITHEMHTTTIHPDLSGFFIRSLEKIRIPGIFFFQAV